MSKLLEKLERVSEGRAHPLGFAAASLPDMVLPMVVIASASLEQAQLRAAVAEASTDALVITVEHPAKEKTLAQLRSVKPAIPWGVRFSAMAREDAGKLIETGCDFMVFRPEQVPASILIEDRIAKVLQIEPSFSDNLVKATVHLPVDAVLLGPVGEGRTPLTVRELMTLERLAAGAGKHVLAELPPSMPVEDIEGLWSIGVRGLVVDLTGGDAKERLSQVREAIRKLPTKKKPREKLAARLPSLSGPATGKPPGEEEEGDEEEP